MIDIDALPEGQQVHADKVHLFDKFRVLEPDMPGFGSADRHADLGFHMSDIGNQLVYGKILAQQHFVADQNPDDVAPVLVGDLYQALQFFGVVFQILVNPRTQGDVDAVFGCQLGYLCERPLYPVGAHRVGLALEQRQVGVDLLGARQFVCYGIVIGAHRRKRESLDHIGPGRLGFGAVDIGPQADCDRCNRRSDNDVNSGHYSDDVRPPAGDYMMSI